MVLVEGFRAMSPQTSAMAGVGVQLMKRIGELIASRKSGKEKMSRSLALMVRICQSTLCLPNDVMLLSCLSLRPNCAMMLRKQMWKLCVVLVLLKHRERCMTGHLSSIEERQGLRWFECLRVCLSFSRCRREGEVLSTLLILVVCFAE
jgi:hypothetical protein